MVALRLLANVQLSAIPNDALHRNASRRDATKIPGSSQTGLRLRGGSSPGRKSAATPTEPWKTRAPQNRPRPAGPRRTRNLTPPADAPSQWRYPGAHEHVFVRRVAGFVGWLGPKVRNHQPSTSSPIQPRNKLPKGAADGSPRRKPVVTAKSHSPAPQGRKIASHPSQSSTHSRSEARK